MCLFGVEAFPDFRDSVIGESHDVHHFPIHLLALILACAGKPSAHKVTPGKLLMNDVFELTVNGEPEILMAITVPTEPIRSMSYKVGSEYSLYVIWVQVVILVSNFLVFFV